MRKFKKLTMTLALLITAVTGAWADEPKVYDSGEVELFSLQVGDILMPGVTLKNSDVNNIAVANLISNRYSKDGVISQYSNSISSIPFSIGENGLLTAKLAGDGPYNCMPITADGKAGNAWVVTYIAAPEPNYKTILIGGTTDPNTIELTPDETGKTWTLAEMPASNIVLQVEYEPTKVKMDVNDNAMGTVEVASGSKVEWTAATWEGWTQDTKEHTVGDITITSSKSESIYEYTSNYNEGKYLHSLFFFVSKWDDNSTVTFSTTGDPFSRIEFTMLDDYSDDWNPSIMPNDNWTFEGKSAVWEGEATKSLKLQSCSTNVSKITFFKGDGDIPDGVTVNGDGTFTVAKTATVKLKATPAEGYKFKCWEDDPNNTNPVREVTIESGMADMTYKAVFEEILYNVTFADGIEEADEWKAEPNAAAKNTEIKVTYSGTKKVIGVKVEKKAPTEGHALSASAVGEIVGSDGKAYAVADKDNLPEGVTAVAMVASKNGSNGLAIQLNSSPVEKTWAEAKTYAEGLTAVPGGTWRLPSMADWQTMFVSCAVTGDAGVSDFMDPIAGFNAKIAATGIEWLSYNYWSSTGTGDSAWYVFVGLAGSPYAAFYQSETSDEYKYLVLGCLFF